MKVGESDVDLDLDADSDADTDVVFKDPAQLLVKWLVVNLKLYLYLSMLQDLV